MDKKVKAIAEIFDVLKCETVRKAKPLKIGEWRYGGGYLYYKLNVLIIERYKITSRIDAYSIANKHFDGNGIFEII